MPIFSNRLKELRKDKGVTQKVVAKHIGIIDQAYQKYEYGKHEPNHETTIKLADFFNCSVDYLLGRTDIKEVLKGASCDEAYLRDEELIKMIGEIQANNIEENEKLKKLMEEFQIAVKKRRTEKCLKD